MKRLSVTGICFPNEYYMVDISERLEEIARMVERGDYFCVNAGRQYGKTTTLYQLKEKLDAEYCVFSMSFEGLSDSAFDSLGRLGYSFFSFSRIVLSLKKFVIYHQVYANLFKRRFRHHRQILGKTGFLC